MNDAISRQPVSGSVPRRATALDALRGFAILTMVLSGLQPSLLPAWMCHAQEPPPSGIDNPYLPGITWVDLVFPFFLFALGAAIPLALRRRIERGMTRWQAASAVLKRGFLLAFFAIFQQHCNPYSLSGSPTAINWAVGLAAFALMFAIWARLPDRWSAAAHWAVRAAGWAGAFALLAVLHYPDKDHPGFWLGRSNIILLVLANAAVAGSLIWLFTQNNVLLRLAVLLLGFGIHLSRYQPGWVYDLTEWSPAGWLVQWRFCKYLFIVIPGTIVGDMIEAWLRRPEGDGNGAWRRPRLWAAALVLLAFVPVNLIGLQPPSTAGLRLVFEAGPHARMVAGTVIANLVLCAIGALLLRNPAGATERFLSRLFLWGCYWLALGFLLEPYQGGIKKTWATMSYYFVTSGLAIFTIMGFTILADMLDRARWLRLLAGNGQNPMIAYVGAGNFVLPILGLTGLIPVLYQLTGSSPWLGELRAVVYTLLVALMVCVFTRMKIFWRT
ncbi:MAG: DUF5009 domain-containing protein [bacterium]